MFIRRINKLEKGRHFFSFHIKFTYWNSVNSKTKPNLPKGEDGKLRVLIRQPGRHDGKHSSRIVFEDGPVFLSDRGTVQITSGNKEEGNS